MRPTARLATLGQVYGCAGLCAAGSLLGLVGVLEEVGYLTWPAWRGVAQAGAAGCAGVVLGLWVPRGLIHRRVAGLGGGEPPAGSASGDVWFAAGRPAGRGKSGPAQGQVVGFAASLTGVLILLLGLAWALAGGGAAGLERYRGLLTGRFWYPVELVRLLLWAPVVLGMVLMGMLTTTVLIALHGWQRFVTGPRTRVAQLWAVILGGAAGAGGLLAVWPRAWSVAALLGPGAVFAAGLLSVFRDGGPGSAYVQRPVRPCARAEALSLLTVALAGVAAGSALLTVLDAGGRQAVAAVLLSGAGLGGLVFARLVLRWPGAVGAAPLALLLSAFALLLPAGVLAAAGGEAGLLRLGVVGWLCAAGVVLSGRCLGRACGSVQYALAWAGTALAAGLGLALACGPALAERCGAEMVRLLGGLTAMAGAGVALILGARPSAPLRVVGLGLIGVGLLVLPRIWREAVDGGGARRGVVVMESAAAQFGRRLVAPGALRTVRVRPGRAGGPGGQRADAWGIDLAGRCWDTVVIERSGAGDVFERSGRRLVGRCVSALVRGGRLVIELPAAGLAEAAWRHFASPEGAGRRGYRLRVARGGAAYEALVFGEDVAAWVAAQPVPEGFEVSLDPLSGPQEFSAARGGGARLR